MNSLFDDSLLQSHSNNDPLLTGNDTPPFNHESHNDLFNQNLLPEAHQYNDSYQESYSDISYSAIFSHTHLTALLSHSLNDHWPAKTASFWEYDNLTWVRDNVLWRKKVRREGRSRVFS